MESTNNSVLHALNKALNGRRPFNADAYTLLLELGGASFLRHSGSTNLVAKGQTATDASWLRMDLAGNKAGFTRLKIHATGPGGVAMHFYKHQDLGQGRELMLGGGRMVSPVEWEHLGSVFEHETGLYMNWSDGRNQTGAG